MSQLSGLSLLLSAPCMPTDLAVAQVNESSVTVSWTAHNRAADYTVSVTGPQGARTCSSNASSCDVDDLPCGSSYNVIVVAQSAAGQSLPSYSVRLETGEDLRSQRAQKKQ